ncbi:MAG: acyl-CoA carboxylase subunit beta [Dehalococcoidia bacterium]
MGERMDQAVARYREIQEKNLLGGGIEHIERQHRRGKLTARERIEILIDPGTFREQGSAVGSTGARVDGRVPVAPCDGAIIGTAHVHGRPVAIYAPDFTVLGGSTGAQHGHKYQKILELAARTGMPLVNLLDSSGGRLGYSDVVSAGFEWQFRMESIYSGVMPQITVLMGPCIAGGAYLPTLCDFILMSRVSANMWLGGPRQTAAATGEQIHREIGSADYHMQLTGTAELVGDDDEKTIELCRDLLRYLPQNYREKVPDWEPLPPPGKTEAELRALVPDDLGETYDVHDVIAAIVDGGEYLEIKDEYAKNLVTCFARFEGEVVGIVANNPAFLGSCLEVDSSDKYYRFLQVLDAYNIPLITLVDTPATVPGEAEEARGLLRHMGKVIDVYATATIPKITIVLREAYADGGSLVMGAVKGVGADLIYAWPIAQFAVEASTLDYRDVYGRGVEDDAYENYLGRSREKVDVFDVGYTSTAQVVDEIILPEQTRSTILHALELTRDKISRLPARTKHHGAPPT